MPPARPTSPLPTLTAAAGRVLRLARAGGGDLTPGGDEARALLAKLAAGERIPALTFDAVVYVQNATSNRNYIRFSPAALRRMTSSFGTKPFLRDHAQGELAARGGTILESKLQIAEGADDDTAGERTIVHTIEAVKPWAQEGVLDGTISTFSIGWSNNLSWAESPLCTVCNLPMFGGDCLHFPGDTYELKGGRKAVCEMLFTDVDGVEVSAVNSPAVGGTGIEEIRAALTSLRAQSTTKEGATMLSTISKILGLADDAPAETVAEATRTVKSRLDGELAAHAQTKEALAKAQTAIAGYEAEAKSGKVDRLIERAKSEGKILPKIGEKGERLESDLEKAVRNLAGLSFEGAEAFVAQLPKLAPVGTPPRVLDPPPEGASALTAEEKKAAKQAGVTEEQFAKTKADRAAARGNKEK